MAHIILAIILPILEVIHCYPIGSFDSFTGSNILRRLQMKIDPLNQRNQMAIDLDKIKRQIEPRKPGDADYAYQYVEVDISELITALEQAKILLEWASDSVIFGTEQGIDAMENKSREWLNIFFPEEEK